jgi:hypothetical protein
MQNKNKGKKLDIIKYYSRFRIDDLLKRLLADFYVNKGVGMGTGAFRLGETRNLIFYRYFS